MVRTVLRGVIGLIGILGLLLALQLWLNPALPAAKLGLAPIGPLGLASIRADLGGFFAGSSILALIAVIRGQARYLTAPVLFIGLALAGRVLTVAMSGLTPDMVQPIVVEAVLVVVLALGRSRI
jgi:hypothetical protein